MIGREKNKDRRVISLKSPALNIEIFVDTRKNYFQSCTRLAKY